MAVKRVRNFENKTRATTFEQDESDGAKIHNAPRRSFCCCRINHRFVSVSVRGVLFVQLLIIIFMALELMEYRRSVNLQMSTHQGVGLLNLKTVADIKALARFPCNYIHDGYYIQESNEMLHQVYQSIFEELDDDEIPIVIEVGGHDGITKSVSLKSSICLGVNTLLIEASPKNYHILSQTRQYDITVNAALCEKDFVEMDDVEHNSGQTKVLEGDSKGGSKVRCTSIDKELDTIASTLPRKHQDKLVLVFLVLDVEGHESIAMRGIRQYSPLKMTMEVNKFDEDEMNDLKNFLIYHQLTGERCYYADMCYNFKEVGNYSKKVFYTARNNIPKNTAATKQAATAYMFYGE